MKSDITLLIACAAALITFLVTRRILHDQLKLGPPTLLAAAVAGLALIGLTSHGSGLIAALLLPYEALAVTLLLLFLLCRIRKWLRKRPGQCRPIERPHRNLWQDRQSPITGSGACNNSGSQERKPGLSEPMARRYKETHGADPERH